MRLAALAAAAFLFAAPASADLCPRWGAPAFAGDLDHALINEASGLAASRQFPDRLYHHNDSGDSGRFFVTDLAGARTRAVNVRGFAPVDAEDMALGPCPEGTCLYLGDIGDNFSRRESVAFVVLRERARFGAQETPLRTIVARYPDGAHDAEAFAVHPNGDLYLITKPIDFQNRRVGAAQVFRLSAAQLSSSAPATFEQIGEIDLPYLLWEEPARGQLATGFDFSPDGTRGLIVTYTIALEFKFDPAAWKPSRTWFPNTDYRIIRLPRLPQAEAIAYAGDGESFFTDTEFNAQFGQAPLYRVRCERAAAN